MLIISSVWQKTSSAPTFPSLPGDISTDVLIIGGGIAGILTAYFLKQKGIDYVLLEKGRILGGTTINTTAKITFQHGLIYSKLIKSGGAEKAKGYLSANRDAFKEYQRLCSNINCGYEVKDNYVYSTNDEKKLISEIRTLERIGYKAKYVKDLNIPIKTVGAVCFPQQAQFNPGQFLSEISKGLNIYENTFVRELIGTTAITDSARVEAKRVIVCTHFPFINKHGSYFLKLYQHRSYCIALENAQDVNGMYVDDNDKGLSFRNYDNCLILGGGAHRTGKQGNGWKGLSEFARAKYPGSDVICKWAAQDCMSLDGMPYIGRYSLGSKGLYVASGFNKWGMTSSMVSAMILSDMMAGIKNDYAELFSPSRTVLHPKLFVNAFEAACGLLNPAPKRCPHLGCALKWNPNEHTWDCSCHGSRFSKDGKVLDNPANGDLKNK